MKNLNKTRNYFIEEIDRNELSSKKHKKFFAALNPFLAFVVTDCVSISAFASLVGIFMCI